jgi:cytochrome c-type protein NapB
MPGEDHERVRETGMRAKLHATLAGALLLASVSFADEPVLKSLRGATPIPQVNPSQTYRMERHDRPIPRNFDKQPPVIPHNVKGYQITRNVNMCMSCHAKAAAPTSDATSVGTSHYLDREGREHPNISARRYFCLQCHVPQFDAEPLVPNTFRSAR